MHVQQRQPAARWQFCLQFLIHSTFVRQNAQKCLRRPASVSIPRRSLQLWPRPSDSLAIHDTIWTMDMHGKWVEDWKKREDIEVGEDEMKFKPLYKISVLCVISAFLYGRWCRPIQESRAVAEKPHDAVVKFDIYWNLHRHRAVLPAIARHLVTHRTTCLHDYDTDAISAWTSLYVQRAVV